MTKVFEATAENGVIVVPKDVPSPAPCLVAVLDADIEALRREAAAKISASTQERMSELLLKNRKGQLSQQERAELDSLAQQFDAATPAKGRALSIPAPLDGTLPSACILGQR
jgi:hypothetical protein